jgi:DNA invertase Pin-like site-specific DNA recombinase
MLAYKRNRSPSTETRTSDAELIERLMQIARGEVRRYLHSIITAATPEWIRQKRGKAIRDGLRAVKEKGIRLGRPRKEFDVELASRLRQSGKSWRQIGRELRVSHSTIRASIAACKDVSKASAKPI